MKRFQIMLPDPMLEDLRKMSELKDISTSELIRRAVELYFKQENSHDSKD